MSSFSLDSDRLIEIAFLLIIFMNRMVGIRRVANGVSHIYAGRVFIIPSTVESTVAESAGIAEIVEQLSSSFVN